MSKPKADTHNSPIPLPQGSRSAGELPGVSIDSGQSTIDGALPYGRRLRRPLPIVVEQDDDEILVSEPVFQMHAGGATEAQALDAFPQIARYQTCLNGQDEGRGRQETRRSFLYY
jgi:hypothetical protein